MTSGKPVITIPKISNQKTKNIQQPQYKIRNPRDYYLFDIRNFELIKKIKSGSFGIINLVRNKSTGEYFAAKTSYNQIKNQHPIFISREIHILMHIQHPTIIKFYGYSHYSFDGDKNITFLMDYMENGSLMDMILKEKRSLCPIEYSNTKKQIILVGISLGMKLLHEHRIIHRDLKPDNVLLDQNYFPIITDFGLSKVYDVYNSMKQSISNCGTLPYMAPEVIEGNKFNTKADVYSFGILMFEVVSGRRAYKSESIAYNLSKNVINGYRPQFDFPIKKGIKAIIEKCWSKDPDDRPTFSEIFNKLSLSQDDSFLQFDDIMYEPTIYCSDDEDDLIESRKTEYGSLKFCLDNVNVEELFDYIETMFEQTEIDKEDEISFLKKENKELKDRVLYLEQQFDEFYKNQMNGEFNSQYSIKVKPPQDSKLNNDYSFNSPPRNQSREICKTPPSPPPSYEKVDTPTTPIKVMSPKDPKTENNSPKSFSKRRQKNEDNDKNKADITPLNFPVKLPQDPKTNMNSPNSFLCKQLKEKSFSARSSLQSKPTKSNTRESASSLNSKNKKKKEKSEDFILVNYFNALSIKEQQKIISKIVFNSSTENSYCKNLNNLLLFLLKFDKNEKDPFLNIISKNETDCLSQIDNNSFIYLFSFVTEKIYTNKLLDSDNFANILNEIKYVYIELFYPSKWFNESFNILSKYNVKIAFYISSINETDNICSYIKYANYIKIGDSVSTFIGENEGEKSLSFNECISLDFVEIPSTITSIGSKAFCLCSSLKQINIPSSVTSIKENAFSQCSSLLQVSFENPSSVESIGEFAFEKCASLKQISIPPLISSLESYVFSHCSSLTQVSIPSSVTNIWGFAFNECKSLKDVSFESGSSLKYIGNYAFHGCSSLENISIPSSVTTIGENAFKGCTSLSQISIPPSLKEINEKTFEGCKSICEIKIPSSIMKINCRAFYGCSNLTNVEFSSTLAEIGNEAFGKCSALLKTAIYSSTKIEKNSFPSETKVNSI